jgi:hypothetical protein
VIFYRKQIKKNRLSHAYREGHSTCSARTQIPDDWLKENDKKFVGAVLFVFSAAFDIIDHTLLVKKRRRYGFTSSASSWNDSYPSVVNHKGSWFG